MKKLLYLLLSVLLLVLAIPLPGDASDASGGKVMRFGTSSLKGTFVPILHEDIYDAYVCDLIFARLLSNDPQMNYFADENSIADAYELSEDHLTYTFRLKKGLKFSDDSPLTASDVAFTFKMIANPAYDGPHTAVVADMVGYEAYHRGKTEDFAGIRVIGDYAISFTVATPNVAKLGSLSSFGILSEEAYAKDTYEAFKAMDSTPVGYGPFMLASFESAQAATLVRNPNWRGKTPALDGVSILIVPPETQITALISGQCDLIMAPTANQRNYDALETGGAHLIQFMSRGYNAILLNLRTPKLADVNVRKALMHGFDRMGFIENEYGSFARPCLAPLFPELWSYPPDDSTLNRYRYDPEKAVRLLEEAGWVDADGDGIREKDGVKLELTLYTYPEAPWPEHLATLLREQWPAIGVGLHVRNADVNAILDAAYEDRAFDRFDMWTQGWLLSSDPDPTELFGEAAMAEGGFNAGGYQNEYAWALFARGRQAFDQAKRAGIYQEWAFLANDELPQLFVAVRDELWATGPNVTGFEEMGPFYDWTRCILDADLH